MRQMLVTTAMHSAMGLKTAIQPEQLTISDPFFLEISNGTKISLPSYEVKKRKIEDSITIRRRYQFDFYLFYPKAHLKCAFLLLKLKSGINIFFNYKLSLTLLSSGITLYL